MLASIRARRTEIWRWAAADQDCSGRTFEIVSVDDNTVEGRLCHVNNFFSSAVPSLAGSFIAPRCK